MNTGQLETGKPITNSKTLGTIILCSVFTIVGLGMVSFACLELHEIQKENQRLWSDLNHMNEKNTLDRKQIEAEKDELQLENQKLKNMATELGLDINEMKNRIIHLQSVLRQVQNKSRKLAEDYQQVSAKNELFLPNLTSCQWERQPMEDEKTRLQSRLDEHRANNTWLETELEKERSTIQTLSGLTQMLEEENHHLVKNLTHIQNRNAILLAENVLLHSNLTSCRSEEQHWEEENRVVWSQLHKTRMNNTLLSEQLANERTRRKELSREQRLLKANLSLVQESSANVSTDNSLLQSNLTSCGSEKQEAEDERDHLQLELNKTRANNTLMEKGVVHEKMMNERLDGENQLLVNTNQRLQANLSFVHHTNEKTSVENAFLLTNLTSCLWQKQQREEEYRRLELTLNETVVRTTLLSGELAIARSQKNTLFEEILVLRANVTLVQSERAHLLLENAILQSNITSCHSEKQTIEDENGILHLKLEETQANNTLLREDFDNEKLKTQSLSAENQLLENTNKRLEFNLTGAQDTRENVSIEINVLSSSLLQCQSENQQKELDQRNMQLKLIKTLANMTFLTRELNNETSRRKTLSEKKQLLQTNLTIAQQQQAILSERNNYLHLNLTSCLAEIQGEQDRNNRLKSDLNETRVNYLLLIKELAGERLTQKLLSTERQTLENTNQILLLNLTETKNTGESLYAEGYRLRLNLTSCQTKKELKQEVNRNLQLKLNEMWANNTVLKEELSTQSLMVESALAQNRLLRSNLTFVQVEWTNISAVNRLLQSSLASCQSERQATEDEKMQLLLQLNETHANNSLLRRALANVSLTQDMILRGKELLREAQQFLLLNISVSQNSCATISAENQVLLTNLTSCLLEKEHVEENNRYLELKLYKAEASTAELIMEWRNVMLEKESLLEVIPVFRESMLHSESFSAVFSQEITVKKVLLSTCEANRTTLVERHRKETMEKNLLLMNISSCLSGKQQEVNQMRNLQIELNRTHVNMTVLQSLLTNEGAVRDKLSAEISDLQANITQAESAILKVSINESVFLSTIHDCNENNLQLERGYQQAHDKVRLLQLRLAYFVNVTSSLEKDVGIHEADVAAIQANLSLALLEKRRLHSILHSPGLRIDKFCNLDTLQCRSCPDGWWEFNSRCYNITEHMTRWKKARHLCLEKGSDLAVVRNIPEQIFLASMINKVNIRYVIAGQKFEGSWVGLIDSVREGRFMWIDNRNTTFTYWTSGNPNNMIASWDIGDDGQDCGVFVPTKMSLNNWDDSQCRNHRTYICESKAFIINPFPPNGS